MQSIAVVALCIVAAIVYGVLHDQVTARVCVEYFTVGHPPVFGTEDPTLLALGWGVIATWWMGLVLGIALALAARLGNRPKRNVSTLLRPVAILMGITALCALIAGLVGWILGTNGLIILLGPVSSQLPHEKHAAFIADLWAHLASYLVGAVGGIVVIIQVWRSRRARAAQ